MVHKLKLLITFISLIKIEQFKAFHVYINLENQFQIFASQKSDFFNLPRLLSQENKTKHHAINF